MSHSNISIFIPHIGCKRQCSFCNQVYITGKQSVPTKEVIDKAVETALSSGKFDKNNGQLAFFGGSFTAIKREMMIDFLEIGYRHVLAGNVDSIRISTRPDAIDEEILEILKNYGVKSIELGAQSMCDDVLIANHRGHTAQDVVKSAELIKSRGFQLGLQMMTGLYMSDFQKDFYTATEFLKLKPDTVRIYPTVILKNTELENLYKNNEYQPLSVEQAACDGAKLLKLFFDNNINVIRFGLHSIEKESFISGAFHPALSEIAQSYIYRDIIENKVKKCGFYTVFVKNTELSKAKGQKKSNIEYFKNRNIVLDIIPDENLDKYQVIIKERKDR